MIKIGVTSVLFLFLPVKDISFLFIYYSHKDIIAFHIYNWKIRAHLAERSRIRVFVCDHIIRNARARENLKGVRDCVLLLVLYMFNVYIFYLSLSRRRERVRERARCETRYIYIYISAPRRRRRRVSADGRAANRQKLNTK